MTTSSSISGSWDILAAVAIMALNLKLLETGGLVTHIGISLFVDAGTSC